MLGFVMLWMALGMPHELRAQQAYDADDYVRVPFNISLVPGVGIGDAIATSTDRKVINVIALNVIGGRAARLEGVEVSGIWGRYTEGAIGLQYAGFANVVEEQMQGIQMAGLANVVGSGLEGVQASGLGNIVGGSLLGVQLGGLVSIAGESAVGVQAGGLANIVGERGTVVQLGGLFNLVGEDGRGAQAGGLFNVVGEDGRMMQFGGIGNITGESLRGLQGAGIVNVVGETVRGVQAAGIINVAGETTRGLQAAGIGSVAGGDLRGVQASGILNVTGGTLRGVQASGVLNVAPVVRGVQLGVVNIADDYERGVPIGLVSYVRRIGLHLDVWADETGFAHVALRSGSARVANIFGVSLRPFGDRYRWASTAGLGVNVDLGRRSQGTVDLMVHSLGEDVFSDTEDVLGKVRFVADLALTDQLALFGGPTFNVFVSDEHDGSDLAPWSVYDDEIDGTFIRMWPGFVAGLRFQIVPGREARRWSW